MSDHELDVADRVVAMCDGSAEVTVRTGQHALTRFANSFIHQNVAESVASVSLRLSYDGRTANASMTYDPSAADLDDSLRTLVARTAEAARLRPVDPEWPGLAQPAPTTFAGSYDRRTAEASPGDRAALVRDFVEAAGDLETAGFCETVGSVVAFANSAGQRVTGETSHATLDGVARTAGADASARRTASSLADLDGVVLGRRAATRALAAVGASDVEPGHYEVVLEPSCVADLVFFVAWQGFNARAVAEGRSFVALGEQQFDRSIQLWDDAADRRTVSLPFDDEGTPKQRLDLVRDGVSVGLAEDLRTAKAGGTTSTGHGIEGGESEGALACNLLLGTGSHDTDELVSHMERGLLVTDFWYTRILDPRTLVVTGLTRNGVFLVENGKVVRPVANLRFTQSYVDAIGPDRVLGIGSVPEMHRQYMASYSVPALRLASWNFTGGAKG
ncbi:TldD/PmbA family protein [Acidothermaceae bacterium B102]|nr:TldD/PmbA family protein [Acidothermaceae bacterium B102]